MKDFWNWMIGLPKCVIGGRCNQNKKEIGKITMIGKIEGVPSFYRPETLYCSKCGNDTTEYGKI